MSTFSGAHRRLKDAQKSSKGAPAYSVYVNRPLGRLFAAAAFQAGMSPNSITYVSAALSLTGIVLLAVFPPSWLLGFGVCAALMLGYAFDAADGQLARLQGGGSPAGEWLDHMIDSAKISSLHLAVLLSAYRFMDLPAQALLLIPLIFTVVSNVHFFGMILVDQLTRVSRATSGQPPPATVSATPVRSLLKIPTDYGVLCLIFAVLGAPYVFFGFYSLLALGSTGYLILILRKWRRDVSGLSGGVK